MLFRLVKHYIVWQTNGVSLRCPGAIAIVDSAKYAVVGDIGYMTVILVKCLAVISKIDKSDVWHTPQIARFRRSTVRTSIVMGNIVLAVCRSIFAYEAIGLQEHVVRLFYPIHVPVVAHGDRVQRRTIIEHPGREGDVMGVEVSEVEFLYFFAATEHVGHVCYLAGVQVVETIDFSDFSHIGKPSIQAVGFDVGKRLFDDYLADILCHRSPSRLCATCACHLLVGP